MNAWKTLCGLTAAALVSGCASDGQTSGYGQGEVALGAINDACPMSGRPVDPNTPTVSYKGHEVGFCCGGCPGPWVDKTEAEKDAFIAQLARE
jgi:hypothetical protein